MGYESDLVSHYERCWGAMRRRLFMEAGPVHELPDGFQVAEFQDAGRGVWIYATVNAATDDSPLEFCLLAPEANAHHVQTLAVLSHFATTGARVGIGHTVNLGEWWLPGSSCSYLLLSRPYLDGPRLEHFERAGTKRACLWVLPITERERAFKMEHGLEALESKFEANGLVYADPMRTSCV